MSLRARSLGWWGMALFVATEATLFAVFLASYFYLRWQSDSGWPPEGMPDPKLLRPTVNTAVMLVSAAPMLVAEAGIRAGRASVLTSALLATLALGCAFVGLQAWDLVEKTRELTPQDGAYGSLVYLITGGHAVHVVIGLLGVAWLAVRSSLGAYRAEGHGAVAAWAIYWYFVVALSIFVWAALVLSPRV